MKQVIKHLALVSLSITLISSFVIFSHGQTGRRTKKAVVTKRKPQKLTSRTKPDSDESFINCLACYDKPKPDVSISNPKTKQKYIIFDCEPVNIKPMVQPKPIYPQAARLVRASGLVKVDVVFDEKGKAIWAKVLEGHPLLRAEALRITCLTRIKPPVNCLGQPRKVNSILTYNFMSK